MRVLVVEDEWKVAEALKEGLTAEHYDVVVERTGHGGMRRGTTEAFDLVLLDLALPGAAGLDILVAIRKRNLRIPVIILTACDTLYDRCDRARRGRRRLPRQTVCIRRTAGEDSRARAARGGHRTDTALGGPLVTRSDQATGDVRRSLRRSDGDGIRDPAIADAVPKGRSCPVSRSGARCGRAWDGFHRSTTSSTSTGAEWPRREGLCVRLQAMSFAAIYQMA